MLKKKKKECERGRNREWICWWTFEGKKSESAIFLETWENKLIGTYSKEVVSLIILGNTFYFYLYPLF